MFSSISEQDAMQRDCGMDERAQPSYLVCTVLGVSFALVRASLSSLLFVPLFSTRILGGAFYFTCGEKVHSPFWNARNRLLIIAEIVKIFRQNKLKGRKRKGAILRHLCGLGGDGDGGDGTVNLARVDQEDSVVDAKKPVASSSFRRQGRSMPDLILLSCSSDHLSHHATSLR